jgi:hypothetical protein
MVAEPETTAHFVMTCTHTFRLSLEERWAAAEVMEGSIGVCVCCDGPLVQVLSPVSDYIPGAPESWGYIGNDSRCKRCPVEA